MQKKTLLLLTAVFILAVVYLAGHYRVFPTHYLHSLKDRIEQRIGTSEPPPPAPPESIEFKSTLLTRLLIKQVHLPDYDGSGGGISAIGDLVLIVSNKGEVSVYDSEQFNKLESAITTAPLNYEGLVSSGHTTRNGFREWWFRVNGVFSEQTGTNRYTLYLSHNRYNSNDDCISHNISKTELERREGSIEQLSDWNTLFAAKPCFDPEPENYVSAVPYSGHISGGAIQPYDNSHLLVTVGDYNHHGLGGMPAFAQDSETTYGKFILLNKTTGDWSIFAKGTRNPSGLHIDPDGTILSVENGPDGGDELNIVQEGANYGWPLVSHGIWYSPDYRLQEAGEAGRHTEFTAPISSWIPSVAPSSIIRLDHDRFPLWKGDLLVGTMRGHGLRRLRTSPDNRVLYDEEIYLGQRVRDLTTLENGLILLLTDDQNLLILDNGGPSFAPPLPDINDRIAVLERFNSMGGSTSVMSAGRNAGMIFQQNCSTCHSLASPGGIGPHLENLYGREIGSAGGFNYSDVLRRDTRTWNSDLLRTFLTEPETEFSGNRMNKVELSESAVDSLVQFFSQVNPELEQ